MWQIFATRCLKYIHKQRMSSLQRGGKPGACLNYAGFTRINGKIKHSVSVMCKFRAVARLAWSLSSLSSSLSEWLHGLIQSEIPNWCSCTPVIPAGLCNSQHQCNTIDKCNAIHNINAIQFDKCNVIHNINTIQFDKCNVIHNINTIRFDKWNLIHNINAIKFDMCNAIHNINAMKFDKCNVIHYTNTTRFDSAKCTSIHQCHTFRMHGGSLVQCSTRRHTTISFNSRIQWGLIQYNALWFQKCSVMQFFRRCTHRSCLIIPPGSECWIPNISLLSCT